MFNKLRYLVIYKPVTECFDKMKKIVSLIRSRGLDVDVYSIDDIVYEKKVEADVVIGIGGDGTLLKISRVFQNYTPLILPIPCGRRKVLYEDISEDVYEDIVDRLVKGEYRIQLHRRIRFKVFEKEFLALNEGLLISSDRGRVTGFTITIKTPTYRSRYSFDGDGLLIGPSTGSAAYNLSARGSLLDYILDDIFITPLNPMELDNAPLILPPLSKITIVSRGIVELYIDGEKTLELEPHTPVEVEPCIKNFRIIRFFRNDYLRKVFRKRRIRYE